MQAITNYISSFKREDLRKMVLENKEPLFLAATTLVAVGAGYKNMDIKSFKDCTLFGVGLSCALQLLGLTTGRKGIASPEIAPHLTTTFAAVNLANLIYQPFQPFTINCAIFSLAFKITTVAFQTYHRDQR